MRIHKTTEDRNAALSWFEYGMNVLMINNEGVESVSGKVLSGEQTPHLRSLMVQAEVSEMYTHKVLSVNFKKYANGEQGFIFTSRDLFHAVCEYDVVFLTNSDEVGLMIKLGTI